MKGQITNLKIPLPSPSSKNFLSPIINIPPLSTPGLNALEDTSKGKKDTSMGHSIIKIKPSGKLPEKSNRENLPNTPPENNITKNPFEFLLTQKRIPSIHAPCVSPKASVFLLKHCNQIAQEYREQSLLNNL